MFAGKLNKWQRNLTWLSYTDTTTWGEAIKTCVGGGGGGYCGGVRHGRGIHSDNFLPRTVKTHAREFHWECSALWEELYCVYTQFPVLRYQWNNTEIWSIARQGKIQTFYLWSQIQNFFYDLQSLALFDIFKIFGNRLSISYVDLCIW